VRSTSIKNGLWALSKRPAKRVEGRGLAVTVIPCRPWLYKRLRSLGGLPSLPKGASALFEMGPGSAVQRT
jgi:hypothetical protein